MSLAGLLSFLTLTGMNTAVTQAVAKGNDQAFPYSVKVQLRWNSLYVAGSLIVAGYYLFQGNFTIGYSLLILSAVVPLSSAFNTYGTYLSGKMDFKTASVYSVFNSIFYAGFLIAALFLSHNPVIIVAGYGIGTLAPAVYFYLRVMKRVPRTSMTGQEKKELFNYGGHLSIVNVLAIISQYIDKVILFHFLEAIQVAIYGLALAFPERIRGYTKTIIILTLPKLSEKTIYDIAPVFYKRIFQSAVVGAFISIIYIATIPIVFKLFLPKYLESIHYSQIISLSLIFTLPMTYMGSVFTSQKMIRTIYLSNTAFNVLKILLFIVFGYLWGVWGVVYASLITYLFGFLYSMVLWELEVKKYRKSALSLPHNG